MHVVDVDFRRVLRTFQCVVQAADARLAGRTAHGAHGHIYDVDAGFDCFRVRVDAVSACIMRMQMDRQIDSILQFADQTVSRLRFQKTGHILDRNGVCAQCFKLFSHVFVVLDRVFRLCRIIDIACVADGCFSDFIVVAYVLDASFHLLRPVQAVEDTENVNPVFSCKSDELFQTVVRIVLISDCIRSTEQHLQ